MLDEQYTFRWTSIESEILKSRRQLFMNKQFADVTLVSDDLVKFPAHRTVLGSASKLFNALLELTSDQAPVLFLKDVPSVQLEAMLQFIYTGEASVMADELVRLSEVAIDLQIHAFFGSNTETDQKSSYNPLLDRKPFEVGFQSEELKSVNSHEDSVPLDNYFSAVSSLALNYEIGSNDSMNKIHKEEEMKFHDSPSKENNKDTVHEKGSDNKIRIRKVEEPSECPICAKVFTTQRSLQRHHQSIHELRQWNCEECGKNFSQSSSLKEHVRTIHLKMQSRQQERKNECKICCEIFTGTKRHMSKHGIIEPQIDVHYTKGRYIRLEGDRSSAAPSIDPVGLSSDV